MPTARSMMSSRKPDRRAYALVRAPRTQTEMLGPAPDVVADSLLALAEVIVNLTG